MGARGEDGEGTDNWDEENYAGREEVVWEE